MHILQIRIFFKREAAYTKGVIPKIWFVVLEEYYIMHSVQLCAILKDISYVLTCDMCSSFKKIYCEKGIACTMYSFF